jgi:hypothetical protein
MSVHIDIRGALKGSTELKRALNRMANEVYKAKLRAARSMEPEIRHMFRVHVERLSGLQPAKPRRRRKGSSGATPLIDTGAYVKGWRGYTHQEGKTELAFVVAPVATHEPSGQPMENLAVWLEFGTSKMPARPHLESFKETVRRELYRRIKDEVASVLRR